MYILWSITFNDQSVWSHNPCQWWCTIRSCIYVRTDQNDWVISYSLKYALYVSQLPATSSCYIHAKDINDLAYGNKIRMLEVDLATRIATYARLVLFETEREQVKGGTLKDRPMLWGDEQWRDAASSYSFYTPRAPNSAHICTRASTCAAGGFPTSSCLATGRPIPAQTFYEHVVAPL